MTKPPDGQGGHPAIEYYLNRQQAIFITAKSQTAQATDTTIEIIGRFDAYGRGFRGLAPEQPALTPDDRSDVCGIITPVVASQLRPLFQMLEMLKQEIAAIKAAPEPGERGACRNYWPKKEIVKEAGIGPAGRQELVHR